MIYLFENAVIARLQHFWFKYFHFSAKKFVGIVFLVTFVTTNKSNSMSIFRFISVQSHQKTKPDQAENTFDDLSDLTPIERRCVREWRRVGRFNVDHFRKVKEARLSIQ